MHLKEQCTRLGIKMFLGYMLIPPMVGLAVLASAGGQEERTPSLLIEKKLFAWKRPPEHTQLPKGFAPVAVNDVSGTWSVGRSLDGSTISFAKRSGNIYDVTFRTGGCLGSWKLMRTAELDPRSGLIKLNKAVREYCPFTYDLIYVVQLGGKVRLVPATALEKFADRNDGEFFRRFYTYTKD